MNASRTSLLKVCRQQQIAGTPELTGQIEHISHISDNVSFKVKWFSSSRIVSAGSPLITKSEKGMPVTWRIATIDGNIVKVEGVKPTVGSSRFIPILQKTGWYSLRPSLSRLFVPSGRILEKFIIGKAVYANNKFVGLVTNLEKGNIKIENAGHSVKRVEFQGQILESMPGDKFTVPLNLHREVK